MSESETGPRLKQSLYFRIEMLDEIRAEAKRLRQPLSKLLRAAWKLARAEIKKLPAA